MKKKLKNLNQKDNIYYKIYKLMVMILIYTRFKHEKIYDRIIYR